MRKFIVYRFKAQAALLCGFCLLAAALVALSSLMFELPVMGGTVGLEVFRHRYPLAAEVLRMRISPTGEEHILSVLYGFALPLLMLLYTFFAARSLQAAPMATGEMFWFVYTPFSPARVPMAHFGVILSGLIIQGLIVPLFALLPMLWQPGWQAGAGRLALAALGSALFFALPAGVFLWFAAGAGREGMSGLPLAAALLLGALRLAANVRALPAGLAFVTPFSLYEAWGLARGQREAWVLAGIACAVGVLCALAAARRFARREMEL